MAVKQTVNQIYVDVRRIDWNVQEFPHIPRIVRRSPSMQFLYYFAEGDLNGIKPKESDSDTDKME